MDPGFPAGVGANPPGWGCQHTILPKFPKLHVIEKILTKVPLSAQCYEGDTAISLDALTLYYLVMCTFSLENVH